MMTDTDATIAAPILTPSTLSLTKRGLRTIRTIAIALALLLLVGNLGIIAASALARRSHAPVAPAAIEGIRNLAVVDEGLWRGGAPSSLGEYGDLAAAGVTTIVDLRAEEWVRVNETALADLGLVRHTIPIRDGQVPTPAQVEAFLAIVSSSDGIVFVHCGAGVGRSGAMVGAYLIQTGRVSPDEAMMRNLAVGTPSLEQIAWVKGLEPGDSTPPGVVTTALSRLLDGPRRIWHTLGF
ncbi:MAG TPA: dual specificity protein phosphatase family protein [Actinomycetota bacterium]|jgi:protein tyrosine phosphatase (PTP) superfamily phosphohydrolase (DUF442 family)